jgi:flagellar basal-body rod modification protein FlgD
MPVNPITVTSPTPPANAIAQNKTTTTTAAPDQFGKDTFLKLLVAQLKYQNPLSPSDPTQFLAQTAQFSMVEKLNDIASNGTATTTAQQQLAAASLIGKNVAWSIDGQTGSGVVSSARFTSDGPVVVIGTSTIPLTDVTEVAAAGNPAVATTATTGATSGALGTGTGTPGAASTDAAGTSTSSSAPPAADQPTT